MDFGNSQTKGQVIIGTVREKVLQPSSQEYIPMPKMNVITEEVDYAKFKEKESGPSCSLAEALEKQDLFINSTLAHIGCDILWRMFKEGKTLYRGAYDNLETLKVIAIPVECIRDRRYRLSIRRRSLMHSTEIEDTFHFSRLT